MSPSEYETKLKSLDEWLGNSSERLFKLAQIQDENIDKNKKVPPWAGDLWASISKVSESVGVRLLVVECSLLEDERLKKLGGERFFYSKTVCADPNSKLLMAAYEEAIKRLKSEGSLLLCEEFHKKLYVLVKSEYGPEVKDLPRSNQCKIYFTQDKIDNLQKPQETAIDDDYIIKHSENFLRIFMDNLAIEKTSPVDTFYLSVPFQRPKATATKENRLVNYLPFDNGGVIVIIGQTLNKSKIEEVIDLYIARLRMMLDIVTLRESSWNLDSEISQKKELSLELLAYAELGHALRPLVSATAYKGAARGLEKLLRNTTLLNSDLKHIKNALRSLRAFDHVAAFGSLLRLNSWLNSTEQKEGQRGKLAACFDDNLVENVRSGEEENTCIDAYMELISRLAFGLVKEFNVSFSISSTKSKDIKLIERNQQNDTMGLDEINMPPLAADSQDNVILMAILMGLVEPLRNAASYLENSPSLRKKIEIYIRPAGAGNTNIYIGNNIKLINKEMAYKALERGGAYLASNLLKRTKIGEIGSACQAEVDALDMDILSDSKSMFWIRVKFTPIELYDYIQQQKI